MKLTLMTPSVAGMGVTNGLLLRSGPWRRHRSAATSWNSLAAVRRWAAWGRCGGRILSEQRRHHQQRHHDSAGHMLFSTNKIGGIHREPYTI